MKCERVPKNLTEQECDTLCRLIMKEKAEDARWEGQEQRMPLPPSMSDLMF